MGTTIPGGRLGFTLIHARKYFNKENQTAMLWDVWNKCTSGAQFKFNCYRQWATLVMRDSEDGSGQFLHSKEGVNQEYPLAMITYVIGVLPLI